MSSETGRPETASTRTTGEQGLASSLGFLAFALSRTQLLLLARHGRALAGHGLSERQYTVLRLIGAVEHRSQRDVGKQLYIDRTTVVQIVDELERMGLVRRQRSITDRRVLTIELTPEGTATSASAAESVAKAEREFLAPCLRRNGKSWRSPCGALPTTTPISAPRTADCPSPDFSVSCVLDHEASDRKTPMTAGEDEVVSNAPTEVERSSAREALVVNLTALSQLGRGRPSDEQAQLRHTVRRFLQSKSPEAQVRADMDSELGYDPTIWRQLADQVGVPGLNVPERFGGAGATEAEMFIVLEEMGRALYCSPYFGSVVLCLTTLLRSGDEDLCSEVVPGITSGHRTAALAIAEGDGDIRRTVFETEARRTPAGWLLTGAKSFVIDGLSAHDLIIAAQCEGEPLLFWVRGDAEGLVRTRLRTLDPTRQLADLQLRDVAARLIKTGSAPVDILAWVAAVATIAQAAEQVGGAELCLESAVEYAKARRQFGRPIGVFQAVKHKCADMLIAVESARSLAQCAYGAIVRGGAEVELAASLAGPGCSEAFTRVAADHIQVLGGLGFTWEHRAHLYYRRAKSASVLFGDSSRHHDRAAQLLGLVGSPG